MAASNSYPDLETSRNSACPVCLEKKRDPRLLPCLHSLCCSCIDNLAITGGKSVACPVCRANFTTSEAGASAFPRDTVSSSVRTKEKCVDCDEDVTMFCRSCQVFVCDAHIASHCKGNAPGGKKSHFFTDLSEASEDSAGPSTGAEKAFPSCGKHGEQMCYHCEDCDTPICGGCAILGNHKGHIVKHATEIFTQRKEKVTVHLKRLRTEVEPRVVNSIQSVEDMTNQLGTRTGHVREEVRSATDKAVQMVRTVSQQLLQKVTDIEEERCKLLDEQHDTLKRQLDGVRNAISFGDRLMQQQLHAECLPQLVALEKRALSLCEEKVAGEPVTNSQLGFQSVEENALVRIAFEAIGQVNSYRGMAKSSVLEGDSSIRLFLSSCDAATFVLQVKDKQNTPVTSKDDLIATRWLKAPEGMVSEVPVMITDGGSPGRYLLSTKPVQAGKYELEVQVNGEALCRHLSVEVVDLMQFDPKECHSEIQLSSDRHTATYTLSGSHKSVLGSVGMRHGHFSWKIKIGAKAHWHGLGVAAKPLSKQTTNYGETYSWSSKCQKYRSSHDSRALSEWNPNDCLQFDLDCDQHTLQMTNLSSGEVHEITDLPDKEFFVWVNLYQCGNTAEFVA